MNVWTASMLTSSCPEHPPRHPPRQRRRHEQYRQMYTVVVLLLSPGTDPCCQDARSPTDLQIRESCDKVKQGRSRTKVPLPPSKHLQHPRNEGS